MTTTGVSAAPDLTFARVYVQLLGDEEQQAQVEPLLKELIDSDAPAGLIAKARYTRSANTQWHVFYDMDQQHKFKSQQANPLASPRPHRRLT